MIEKVVNNIMKRIELKHPHMDIVRRDTIWFRLMVLFDEVPKFILMCLLAYWLHILPNTLLAFFSIGLYRAFSGGFHLKTQIGCFALSMLVFSGVPLLSEYIVWSSEAIKYLAYATIWIFNMTMIYLYAPADTEKVPIINHEERRKNRTFSFLTMNLVFIAGLVIKDSVISNIFVLGTLVQSFNISRIAYIIFDNKYGDETYAEVAETIT